MMDNIFDVNAPHDQLALTSKIFELNAPCSQSPPIPAPSYNCIYCPSFKPNSGNNAYTSFKHHVSAIHLSMISSQSTPPSPHSPQYHLLTHLLAPHRVVACMTHSIIIGKKNKICPNSLPDSPCLMTLLCIEDLKYFPPRGTLIPPTITPIVTIHPPSATDLIVPTAKDIALAYIPTIDVIPESWKHLFAVYLHSCSRNVICLKTTTSDY